MHQHQSPYETLLLLQTSDDHMHRLEAHYADNRYWMNQKQLAALFGVELPSIAHHLYAVYQRGELDEATTSRKFEISQQEGRRIISRNILFYSFEVVIALGYRCNSTQASQFRMWMTSVIKLFMEKGFVLDDARLSREDRLEELLVRLDEIKP